MTVQGLAACLVLALRAAGEDQSYTSELYWHTRERCFELAKILAKETRDSLCFIWSSVLVGTTDARWLEGPALITAAGDLWERTMHPSVLIDAVHSY